MRVKFNPRDLPADLQMVGATDLLDTIYHVSTEEQDFSLTILGIDLGPLGCILLFILQYGNEVKLNTEYVQGLRAYFQEDGTFKLGAAIRV